MGTTDKALCFWAGSIGGLLAVDVAINFLLPESEATFSSVCRNRFHVEHPIGEAIFVGTWLALSAWWIPHIVRPARLKRRLLSLPS